MFIREIREIMSEAKEKKFEDFKNNCWILLNVIKEEIREAAKNGNWNVKILPTLFTGLSTGWPDGMYGDIVEYFIREGFEVGLDDIGNIKISW